MPSALSAIISQWASISKSSVILSQYSYAVVFVEPPVALRDLGSGETKLQRKKKVCQSRNGREMANVRKVIGSAIRSMVSNA